MLPKKKMIIIGASIVFLLGNAVGAMASSKFKEIKAILNPSLNVEFNGEQLAPMKAINYEGTTYLPIRNISEIAALDSRIEFDSKKNKLIIGGPMYLNLYSQNSDGFYQMIVNGNWHPSIITPNRKIYSNYYMGVDFFLETEASDSLDEYYKSIVNDQSSGIKITSETDTEIFKQQAKEATFESSDSIGKLAIIQNGNDFIIIRFFVDKTRFKQSDFKEYDKMLKSFNIQ
ncbi:hypothetical protein VN24_15870 [Paenibacillus beijingensis]|uniref:Copper amine oxidase-like N-terminal domain-containing protein n=2 Tax=Paenibacillus beijingensis TaxID=1126833 RepID=A0A0D5NKV8_9BACL|nr:hypothetical protein VN24_15870 [Paenibacillus beijingensis]